MVTMRQVIMYLCQQVIDIFMFENNDLFKKLMQGDEQYQKSKKEIAEFNKKNPELAQAFYDSDESTSYTCSDDE